MCRIWVQGIFCFIGRDKGEIQMLKIAICDDEQFHRENLRSHILSCTKQNDIPCEIDLYASGTQLVDLGIEIMQYNAIYLDINMEDMDGIALAKLLRECSKEIPIIFVTAFMAHTIEGYTVNALRYILKGREDFLSLVCESLGAVMEKINYQTAKHNFQFPNGTRSISLDRVLYIESKLHQVEIHVMENEMKHYTLQGKLSEIEESLEGYQFLRVHQSYLVNMKYIKEICRYKAVLTHLQEIPIPKVRFKEVQNKYIEFCGEW